jgi:hypothetical protein
MNTPKSDAATGSTDDNFNGSSNADAIKPSNTEQVLHTEVEKVGDGFDNC